MRMSYIQYSYDHTTILGFPQQDLPDLDEQPALPITEASAADRNREVCISSPATLSSFRKSTIWLVI